MRTTVIVLLPFLAAIAGCAAPGAPIIREGEAGGNGSLVQGCQNVSLENRRFALPNEFITSSYLTTWSSAIKEGALEGYQEAAEKARASGNTKSQLLIEQIDLLTSRSVAQMQLAESPASSWPETVNTLAEKPQPFCKIFFADQATVFNLVETIFSQLDYPIEYSDDRLGHLETEFVERRHAAARWRDRYVIHVVKTAANHSVLIVRRPVFIDRSGEMFNEAISVGHNEAWIIKQVSRVLDGRAREQ